MINNVDIELVYRIDRADISNIKFSKKQVDLFAELELTYYGESIISEELIAEGMVEDEDGKTIR